ncbi:cytochrome c biogenesis CcdA family protein [Clostridium rectalis]|uniref:cytochrome c biogenesis CcdA family protein n=1 Tax=Clostridium rectalis TaxID=2040295 RepID=UPI0019D2195E|nr:cytochrome c biogenesis protein CcdA [Clostridium rectalis]
MQNNISILLAFSSGVLSFFSPCVLPLVPMYLSYLAGTCIEDLKYKNTTVIYKSIGFTIGFSLIFIMMGVSITSLGKLFINYKSIFMKIGGSLIILFGIHTTGLLKIKLFYYEKRLINVSKIRAGVSSIFMGMAFAIGWTPCIGPILASILIYTGSFATINAGILLLLVYSLGLAIPFVISAFLIEGVSKYIFKFSKYFNITSIVSGILLIIMGIMTFTNKTYILNNIFR